MFGVKPSRLDLGSDASITRTTAKVFLFWTVGNMQMMDVEVCKGKMRSHRLYQMCQDCFVSSQQGSHVGKAGCCAESYQKVGACQSKSGLESQYEVMNNKLGTSINFLSNVASGGCMTTAFSFPTIHKCASPLMSSMPISECGTQHATPAVTTFA